MMTRRAFLCGLTLGTLAAPLAVEAQPAEKVARVAILSAAQRSPTGYREFLEELRALGWVEGRNLLFEARVAEGRYERLPSLTADILNWQPHVICTVQTPATQAAMKATSMIPIVMMGNGDPVRYGLVRSLPRPEANVTGSAWLPTELAIKLIEMLRSASIARQNARQVDKLLRGARPRDVPVELPERFELIVNARTARALDITLPQSLLVRADRIIE